ncbi:MAG: hypothetical protein HC859_09505, partial [Bacteroidia bacterium]|nr:hypothetical protein [Bacteroidia bacterium]
SGLAGLNTFHNERFIRRTDGYGLLQAGAFDESNAATNLLYNKGYENNRYQIASSLTARYKSFISVTLTGSLDKLSTLPHRSWLPGGHAGFAFNAGDLPNLSLPLWMSNAKLFGSIGAMPVEAPFYIDPSYQQALQYDVTDPILYAERIPLQSNDGLQPEILHDREAGFELELLQNRVEMSMSLYTREYRNAYTPVSTPNGFQLVSGTAWRNRGIEISLEATPLQGTVQWNSTLSFTRARTRVNSLPVGHNRIAIAGFNSLSTNLVEGQPYGVLVGTRYLRDDEGKRVIGDDGFPLVDPTPAVIGDPNPDWMLGWRNEWRVKGVSLEAVFDIRHGGDRWNGTANVMNYLGTSNESGALRDVEGYVFEGVTNAGEVNAVPVDFAPATGDVYTNRWTRYGFAGVGEEAIEDASWVRLRYVAIGYALPRHMFDRFGLKKIEFKVFANNLWLHTKYTGVDPETSMSSAPGSLGLDYFNLPGTRTMGIALKIGF